MGFAQRIDFQKSWSQALVFQMSCFQNRLSPGTTELANCLSKRVRGQLGARISFSRLPVGGGLVISAFLEAMGALYVKCVGLIISYTTHTQEEKTTS